MMASRILLPKMTFVKGSYQGTAYRLTGVIRLSSLQVRSHSHSHGPVSRSNPDSHSHAHSHSHGSSADPCMEDDHVHLKSSESETNDQLIFGVKGKHFEYINGSGNDSPSTSVRIEDAPKKKSVISNDNLNSMSAPSHSHSHLGGQGHSHTHSTELLKDINFRSFINNKGARITVIGLLTNVGMAVAKGVGGVMFHSQALLADAAHSISDLVSDFLTLFTISFSSRHPDSLFPNGYGKIESLGSLSVSSLLLVAGVSIGYSSLVQILGPMVPASIIEVIHHYQELFHIHSSSGHSHAHAHATDINAAWIAAGSIAVKEWLYQATKKVAIERNSNVLLANAWHHRVDSLTSIAALITITGGIYFNVSWLDPLGGLLVSLLIIKAGFDGFKVAVFELIDRALPANDATYVEIEQEINTVLSKLLSNNNSGRRYTIEELSILSSGPNYVINNLKLLVPKQRWENVLTINEFENVTRILKEKLFDNRPNLKKISIEFIEEEHIPEVKQ
ncbi:Mmt1 protein [Saccharomycopsis crataegensis]|uniref:Mmt1 protein n=1 Tax=Saccharomycopsis crataegensis TaxID=43959 RepID=A0AAV5QR81_9ASCO|nr:Mmt1 protein [Saccharomycopsis crataegensis]